MGQVRYRVYFTPVESILDGTYADEIDVSDRIEIGGIGNVKRGLDSSDYDIGLFYYSDITLTGLNKDGYFNESFDKRSIFPSTRDLCKVRIVFSDLDITRVDGQITDTEDETVITFKGIINEDATKAEAVTDKITFKVLAYDSVLRTTQIATSVINDGSLASLAFFNMLNNTRITSLLTLDADNINPDYDCVIDDGTKFNNKSVREMLNQLLVATNSVLYVNSDNEIIIQGREETLTTPIQYLYGHGDILRRENVITLTDYNPGIQRTFTSCRVNDTIYTDTDFALTYGFRQKKITYDFITDTATELQIATNIVEAFKEPLIECKVTVSTRVSRYMALLDRISLNFPLRVKPYLNSKLTIVEGFELGDSEFKLPYVFGSIAIKPEFGFKILEIVDNPRDFTTTLKLRQVDDKVFLGEE